MALHEINLTIPCAQGAAAIPADWAHSGVVGSGDMEVLMQRGDFGGAVRVKIVTPVTGYDEVWEKVLRKFVEESKISDTSIEINDNNSTPYIVAMRLKQGLLEMKEAAI